MEVCEVGVYFQNPIRLCKNYGSNIDKRHSAGEKRFVLEPGDDIVQRPGSVEEDGADREPPLVDGGIEEYEEAVPDTKYQLHLGSETARIWPGIQIRAHLDQNKFM